MRASAGKSSITYAILSNTIVLILIGFFSLLYLHTNSITNLVKEKINILVELESDSITNKEATMGFLQKNTQVLPGSIKFIPNAEADKILGIEVSQNLKEIGNPFKNIVAFNFKADHYNDANLTKLKTKLKEIPGVYDVFYENVVVENIKSSLHKISFIVLLLSLIFVFLAIVIIYNTINLSLFADRWEIKTMEIIGARDNFIRQPYIKIAGKIALISFGIASFILLCICWYTYSQIDSMSQILKWYFIVISLILIFIISLFITVGATISIVNKYLYKTEEELY
jgi:cell division transport system permease protein